MIIAFLIFVLFVSELGYILASQQQIGIVPYPFGVTAFCMINHLTVLITGIWYLGWIAGIILLLLHVFGLIHACFGWILSVLSLPFMNSYERMDRIVRTEVATLSFITPAFAIFMIASFFVTDYKCVFNTFEFNYISWITIGVVFLIGNFLRMIVSKLIVNE